MGGDLEETARDDDQIQEEVDGDEQDGDADGLLEPLEKDRPEEGDEDQGDADGPHVAFDVPPLRLEEMVNERVLDDVRGGVGGRERDGDDEVGGDEPEERQHEELPLPAREQMFEHRDGAFAVRTLGGDSPVDGERAEERQQDEDERRNRRERPGGEGGDAGLVAQSREIVHARQAHHLPPLVRVVLPLTLVRPLDLLELALEQPTLERTPTPRPAP